MAWLREETERLGRMLDEADVDFVLAAVLSSARFVRAISISSPSLINDNYFCRRIASPDLWPVSGSRRRASRRGQSWRRACRGRERMNQMTDDEFDSLIAAVVRQAVACWISRRATLYYICGQDRDARRLMAVHAKMRVFGAVRPQSP